MRTRTSIHSIVIVLLAFPAMVCSAAIQQGEMAGYLFGSAEKVPEEFNGGFSLYAAAWPLVETYPGHRFQTGLCGTWMGLQNDADKKPEGKCYTDIEGGLGWWRDTHFPTITPKFIMGGVAANFRWIANGPGYGAGTWEKPRGQYGVAQLSPWLLFPLDGLNLKQGTRGELFGYGYLPLPLTNPKTKTAGKNVPTGNHCWTLFLNTANFKGPVAFFTPFFWSQATIENPEWAGLMLDSRPAGPNKAIQMETQHVPAILSTSATGRVYARVAPTSFPVGRDGCSTVLHRLTAYKKSGALGRRAAVVRRRCSMHGPDQGRGVRCAHVPARGRLQLERLSTQHSARREGAPALEILRHFLHPEYHHLWLSLERTTDPQERFARHLA